MNRPERRQSWAAFPPSLISGNVTGGAVVLKKWLTCSELCERWQIHECDLAEIIDEGRLAGYDGIRRTVLKPYKAGHDECSWDDGAHLFRGSRLGSDEVTKLIFLISDVEAFEKENGISPHELSTDHAQQGPSESPAVEPGQDNLQGNMRIIRRRTMVLEKAARLRREFPDMDKVAAKNIINSDLIANDDNPYSRTQFNRIVEPLGFPPAPRGRKPARMKK
jgi:hypothetical protein